MTKSNVFIFLNHLFEYPELPAELSKKIGVGLVEIRDDIKIDWGEKDVLYKIDDTWEIEDNVLREYMLSFMLTRSRWFKLGAKIDNKAYNNQETNVLKNQALYLLNYANAYLKLYEPKFVIISRLPHTGFDFSMYTAAKIQKIPVLFFLQTPFPYKFAICTDLDDIGRFSKCSSIQPIGHVVLEKTTRHQWFYMNAAVRKPLAIKIRQKGIWGTIRRVTEIGKQYVDQFTSPQFYIHKFGESKHHRAYRAAYNRCAKRPERPTLEKKFIYFAFHLEPESSTVPRAGIYADQVLALERLSAACPNDWKILAKENPKQGYFGRDEYFFSRLKALKNVIYVRKEFPSTELIDNAQIVASVNGTVGWEAIQGGKPAIYFGNPWYRELPGVYKFEKGLDLEKIKDDGLNHERLEIQIALIQSKMCRGVIFKKYEKIVEDFDRETNVKDIVEDIAKYLECGKLT